MSDDAERIELPETSRKTKKKRTVRPVRVALFSTALLVSAAALLLWPERGLLDLDQIGRSITYRGICPQPISVGCGAVAFDGKTIAVCDDDGLRLLADDGTRLGTADAAIENPGLLVQAERAVCYDRGGSILCRLPGRPERLTGRVLDADLSEHCFACILLTDGRTELLWEQDGLSRKLTPDARIYRCAVNDDGSCLAAACSDGTGGSFASSLLIWQAAEEAPRQISLDSRPVSGLDFLDDGTLCVTSEHGARLLTADGRILAACDFGDDSLACHTVSDRGAAFALRCAEQSRLLSFDTEGRLLGSENLPQILAMDSCGKYLAYATADSLTVTYRDLRVYRQAQKIENISALHVRSDGTVMAVSNGTAQLYFYD